MPPILWFAAGAIAVAAVHWLRGRRFARRGPIPAPPPPPPTLDAPIELGRAARAAANRALVAGIGEELAILASGIEGRAHLLIEAAPERRNLPAAAEGMLKAVQRLRTLHRKIVAFSSERGASPGSAELADVARRLADDLQELQFGIELHCEPTGSLPPIAVAPPVVADILVFLSVAMLRTEPGATRLTLVGERNYEPGAPTSVTLELSLEWASEHAAPTPNVDQQPIDFEAAANLVRAQGGSIELTHAPGRVVRALVVLPAKERAPAAAPPDPAAPTAPEPAPAPTPPPATAETSPIPPPVAHGFGGALLLEPDPTLRAMVARELKASGRAVFACADSASARAFLETTPERFELLVVDHPRRLAGQEALATAVLAVAPDLKIFVLDTATAELAAFPTVHSLPKPFGVPELREALALALAAR